MVKASYNPEIWGGIECTINRVKKDFFDQLSYSGHYARNSDIEAIASMGIKKLRYPVLWEKHQPQINAVIDWTWITGQLNAIRSQGIDVIAGLVHHGSGPAFTSLSDPRFPELLAAYAGEVARQFPWIEYYTPVNEPVTTARFSGLYGLWYPHKKNAKSFAQMLLNELKGTVLAMQEIRKVNPSAKLVQTEDLGKTYSTPKLKYQAKFENERRWLTYDILCGLFHEKHPLWKHFIKLGIPKEDLHFFLQNPCTPDIFGFNHYLTSERYLDERLQLYPQHTHGGNRRHRYADVEVVRVEVNEETGIEVLLKEAWDRYKKPMVVTEVHLHSHREEQLRWFRHVWEAAKKLRSDGVDLVAITSWAMLGSYGWNRLLTRPGGDYEPGVFDLSSGFLRPTALASFIREITKTEQCNHHLSDGKGWWQRSTRILYGPVIKNLRMNRDNASRPLLIIGKNGTLGRAFARVCEDRTLAYHLLSRQDCDITNLLELQSVLDHYRPWAVINAAGYVRVDDAEKDIEKCRMDNAVGPHNLAVACAGRGIQLVNFSSDLVFDGKKANPYMESDLPNPLNVYGKTKAEAEHLVLHAYPGSLMIRTSAFFSPWDEYNFVHYVRRALAQYEPVTVAHDLFISPTYVPDLVHVSLDLLIDQASGIWHLANKGSLSWADLAYTVAEGFGQDKSGILPVPAEDLHYPAPRPAYSVLGSEKGNLMPSFEHAMERYIREEQQEKLQPGMGVAS